MMRLIFAFILGQFCLLAAPIPMGCVVQGNTQSVRATGVAELLGDILIICSSGTDGNTQLYDIDVSLSVPVTSANPSAQKSDVLLFIDEPARVNWVANVNVFLGEFVAPAAGAAAPHTIRFKQVPIAEPGTDPMRILRVSNLRGNVAAAPYNDAAWAHFLATVDSSPRMPGLPGTTVLGVRGGMRDLTTTVGTSQIAGYQLQVDVGEVFTSALRRRLWPGQASGWILGIPYTEESGVITDLFQSSGGGISGLADSGTRIVLRFSNVSVGQQVYVSTRPIAMSSGLDLRLTTGDQGGAGVFSEVPASSPSPAPGIAPVAIANGQGIAVYEVLQSEGTAFEWARFGVVLQGGSGTPTVEAMCGPLTTSQQPWIPRFALPRTPPVITPAGVFRDVQNRVRLTEFGSQTIYNAGGHFSGKPGAAQDGDGNTWIVGRDTSNGLWITRFSGSTKQFDNWIFLGGLAKGDPSVAVAPSGVVSYAVRDHWNGCWLGTFRPGIGSEWRNLGGIFATDPQITSAGPEGWVAGKDNWNGVWTLNFSEWFTPLQVPLWTFRGGILQGQLSLSHEGSIAMLAGRDHRNALWFAPFHPTTVLPWIHAQGILGRDPVIAATTAVVADNDSILLRPLSVDYPNFVVQPWVSTGGVLKSESAAWLDNSLYIVGRDAGNQIWWYRSATGQWTATGAAGVAASDITAVPR